MMPGDHGARLFQCDAKTIAERMKPMTTLTIAPALKARNGFLPTLTNSRKRVVNPMLRKRGLTVSPAGVRCVWQRQSEVGFPPLARASLS